MLSWVSDAEKLLQQTRVYDSLEEMWLGRRNEAQRCACEVLQSEIGGN